VHRPAFTATFVAEPGVDGIKSFRALLKSALRRFGLRATDVRELNDERQTGRSSMPSEFSKRVRAQRDKGLFKVADFKNGPQVYTISHLDEQMTMFGKEVDLLNFQEVGRQLQLNQTTSEWLLDNLGDDPDEYAGQRVELYLGEYTYEGKTSQGIRLRRPGEKSAPKPTPKKPDPAGSDVDLDDEIPWH
jgi:hypothetical protein